MTVNRNRILLNCEIEEVRPKKINNSLIQTVISVLSVVMAFVILCAVTSQMKSGNSPSNKNVHQAVAAGQNEVCENEAYFF